MSAAYCKHAVVVIFLLRLSDARPLPHRTFDTETQEKFDWCPVAPIWRDGTSLRRCGRVISLPHRHLRGSSGSMNRTGKQRKIQSYEDHAMGFEPGNVACA